MAEYIKREDVLQHKRKMRCADFHGGFWDFIVRCEDVERIPAADVVEVRNGEWVDVPYVYIGVKRYMCNQCADDEFWCKRYVCTKENYCPNCGAKMRGGE